MASALKRKVDRLLEPVSVPSANESDFGILTIGHWRVKIHNDISKDDRIQFKSLSHKWNTSGGDNFKFFDKVQEEYGSDELHSLTEYVKMMRTKEVEYLSLAHTKMEYDILPDEVKQRMREFDSMDAEEIRERQAELKAYSIYLTYLLEVGHTVHPDRGNYERFIGVIGAVKSAESEAIGDSVFRRLVPQESEPKSDSQFDRDYVEEKNQRMQAKNARIAIARANIESQISAEMS